MKTLLLVSALIFVSACCKKTPRKCVSGEIVQIGACDSSGHCSALVDVGTKRIKIETKLPVIGETYKNCK